MFDINELRFLDHLVDEYLTFNQNLPLKLRNQILKLDNKIIEYMKDIKETEQREFEEDMQELKKIVK